VAKIPTTIGVIAELKEMHFSTNPVGVQLYGNEPNLPLQSYLRGRGLEPVPVAPYIYAEASDENRVLELIQSLEQGDVDAIVFTSQPQVRRLFAVAGKHGYEASLYKGLKDSVVAAVGPLVAECLLNREVQVDATPDERFFMRPLIDVLMKRLATQRRISHTSRKRKY